jgi:hypothetical protein
MQRKSQGPPEPLSTHSSIQILAKENSLPDVRAYWSVGSDAGEISGVLFLTVEAGTLHLRVRPHRHLRYRRNQWMSPWHENAAYLPP